MIFLLHLWSMIKDISPFLLLGFLICGILSTLLTVDTIKKYLGKKSITSIFLGSLLGVPIPLCSCGVIPVTAYLRKHGATKGATSSFLISTPQTGVDSIFITYGLLGPVLAIYRPFVALFSGFLGGTLTHIFDKDDSNIDDIICEDECCNDKNDSIIKRIFNYGFVRLPIDIVNPLVFGLLLSTLISIFVPSDYFLLYGHGILGMLIMLCIGLPTYVCATASVPIAAALYGAGFSIGAVLVFLMSGPATNITTISVCWKILGKRSTFIYLMTIIFTSILAGLFLDILYPQYNFIPVNNTVNHFFSTTMKFWTGLVFLLLMIYAFLNKTFLIKKESLHGNGSIESLNVNGMTCSHCEESVQKTLLKIKGIENVVANANLGTVEYKSKNDNHQKIVKTITDLGFKVIDD